MAPHDRLKTNIVPALASALTVLLSLSASSAALAVDGYGLSVLSSRPDMVSGGDALVQLSGSSSPSSVSVALDGKDVTSSFHVGPNGMLIGRIEGLKPGKNILETKNGSKIKAKLELVDHPITGPIFSGPHQTPFVCETNINGLGPAQDTDCSAKTIVSYYYKSTDPVAPRGAGGAANPPAPAGFMRGFKSYDPSGPRPADIAQTTISDGKSVDYIVRREIGTINRAVYDIEFLHQPGTPLPTPWNGPVPGWNGRLVYTFGGGCEAGYHQARLPLIGTGPAGVLHEPFLSQGYAVATSTQNVFGNTCNDRISAETLSMVKEHFVKEFGSPVHTIGSGGSGGSMQQHLIAQDYPGLLDGIMPSLSYPDIISVITPVVDCALLDHAFNDAKENWTEDQKTAVAGFATWQTCAKALGYSSWGSSYSPAWVVATSCNNVIPKAMVYDATNNPKGARCSIYDNEVNVFGRDPKTGFARRPLDNVGVQYGIVAFNAGKISAEQFVELNEKAGGYDNDGNIVASRSVADPEALRIAYQSGVINTGGGGLRIVPMIDFRPYVDTAPDIHDRFRSFVTRARLMAANGNADNQVILVAPGPGGLQASILNPNSPFGERTKETVRQMDRWLDAIAEDNSVIPVAAKIAKNKPVDLVDACWTADGQKIAEPASIDSTGRCNKLYPPHADPRIAAGGPLTDDVLKCALKPIAAKDYAQPLSADQVGRMKAVFARGVCDYSRPGIGQQVTRVTWQRPRGQPEPVKAASN